MQSFHACIRHYSPRRQGGSRRTVLAHITGISPLRGSLRAAPIAWSRFYPGLWLDRSIITGLLTRVGLVQNQPQCETARHRLLCGRMGTALHLPWPSLMRSPAQVVLAHPPASLWPPSRRASRQRTYPAAGYSLFNIPERLKNWPLTAIGSERPIFRTLFQKFFNFFEPLRYEPL